MGDFNADWLALREPADRLARSAPLTQSVCDVLGRGGPLQVLDLAAGTGANVRYLAGRLIGEQSWLLVDGDATLLAQIPARMSAWGSEQGFETVRDAEGLVLRGEHLTCRVATRCLDLAALDDVAMFEGRALVTASALLDLVSERWLGVLAERCRRSAATVLFALTYDGRIRCAPEEPEDDLVQELVNRHQRSDKGFGEAAGPDATDRAERCFTALGYRVQRAPSAWELPPDARELQHQLIEGWAHAATAIAPERAASIRSWRERRLAHVAAGRSRLVVGHEDLAAWLP